MEIDSAEDGKEIINKNDDDLKLDVSNNTNEKEQEKRNIKEYKSKRYKIQEVINPNQVILVQVIKDERGQRGL